MVLKYDIKIKDEVILKKFSILINQVYKLLPIRQEGGDWRKLLQSILEESAGMQRLMLNESVFFALLVKLQGLFSLTEKKDFLCYRKTIFECLNLIEKLREDFSNDRIIK